MSRNLTIEEVCESVISPFSFARLMHLTCLSVRLLRKLKTGNSMSAACKELL
jgi:hypothetical protein